MLTEVDHVVHRRLNPRGKLMSNRAMNRKFINMKTLIEIPDKDSQLADKINTICLTEPADVYIPIPNPKRVMLPLYPNITSHLYHYAKSAHIMRKYPETAYFHAAHGTVKLVDQIYLTTLNRMGIGPTSLVPVETEYDKNKAAISVSDQVLKIGLDGDSFGLCGNISTLLGVQYLFRDQSDYRSRITLFSPEVVKSRFDGKTLGDRGRKEADIKDYHRENRLVYRDKYDGSDEQIELINVVCDANEQQIVLAALMCKYYIGTFTHWVAILGIFKANSPEEAASLWRTPARELAKVRRFDPNIDSLNNGFIRFAGDLSPWGISETPVVTATLENFTKSWAKTMGSHFDIHPAVRNAISKNLHISNKGSQITKNYGIITLMPAKK